MRKRGREKERGKRSVEERKMLETRRWQQCLRGHSRTPSPFQATAANACRRKQSTKKIMEKNQKSRKIRVLSRHRITGVHEPGRNVLPVHVQKPFLSILHCTWLL